MHKEKCLQVFLVPPVEHLVGTVEPLQRRLVIRTKAIVEVNDGVVQVHKLNKME